MFGGIYYKSWKKFMKYYILLPEDSENDVMYSTNTLGEVSFKNFWAEQGFELLQRIVNKYPDIVYQIKIKDERNKDYKVSEFLDIIEPLRIIKNE